MKEIETHFINSLRQDASDDGRYEQLNEIQRYKTQADLLLREIKEAKTCNGLIERFDLVLNVLDDDMFNGNRVPREIFDTLDIEGVILNQL